MNKKYIGLSVLGLSLTCWGLAWFIGENFSRFLTGQAETIIYGVLAFAPVVISVLVAGFDLIKNNLKHKSLSKVCIDMTSKILIFIPFLLILKKIVQRILGDFISGWVGSAFMVIIVLFWIGLNSIILNFLPFKAKRVVFAIIVSTFLLLLTNQAWAKIEEIFMNQAISSIQKLYFQSKSYPEKLPNSLYFSLANNLICSDLKYEYITYRKAVIDCYPIICRVLTDGREEFNMECARGF